MKKVLLAIIICTFVLTGCSTANENSKSETTNEDGFPITIEHAFGKTVIDQKPKRIATIAWGNQDTALALGIVPVGVSKGNFGKLGDNGLSLWTEEAFKDLDEDSPNVFDDTDGLDFEAIADSKPDIILAAYSGLTQEDYDTLSQIAPVIAYPDKPWQTYWREQTLINATAMGLKEEGQALIKETEELISSKLSKYDAISDKTGAFLWINPTDTSSFYAYLLSDPRANYLVDLGLTFPKSLEELSKGSKDFSITLSSENADQLNDIDIIVTYGDKDTLATLQKDPLLGKIPAIKNGSVVIIDSSSALAGSATPTILGIPYTIDEYLTLINEAAVKVK